MKKAKKTRIDVTIHDYILKEFRKEYCHKKGDLSSCIEHMMKERI